MERPAFAPCAAAALYRRRDWIDAQATRRALLLLRRRRGPRLPAAAGRNRPCWYVPDAVVAHVGSGTSRRRQRASAVYHGHRNLAWTFVKDMPGRARSGATCPLHLASTLVSLVWFTLRGRGGAILPRKVGCADRSRPRPLREEGSAGAAFDTSRRPQGAPRPLVAAVALDRTRPLRSAELRVRQSSSRHLRETAGRPSPGRAARRGGRGRAEGTASVQRSPNSAKISASLRLRRACSDERRALSSGSMSQEVLDAEQGRAAAVGTRSFARPASARALRARSG